MGVKSHPGPNRLKRRSIYAPLALVGALLAIGMLNLILCVPRPGPEVTLAEPSRP